MSTPEPDRVNAELRTILTECSGAPNPIDCLAVHIARLRANPAWTELEVSEVEHAALRIIQSLMTGR